MPISNRQSISNNYSAADAPGCIPTCKNTTTGRGRKIFLKKIWRYEKLMYLCGVLEMYNTKTTIMEILITILSVALCLVLI